MSDSLPGAASSRRPTVLCILDGWGYREKPADNAVALAQTPVFDRLWQRGPRTLLSACGEDVGLPAGQIGNSEVGHMNLGAGRVVFQDLPRIDRDIAAGALDESAALANLVQALRASGGVCHVLGLVSPGGVHAHQDHIAALVRWLQRRGIPVAVHIFTDGRDVPPKSARTQVAAFLEQIAGLDGVTIASLSGRYYAMDRDKRWDRVARAWTVIVDADGPEAETALAAIDAGYAAGMTDEFLPPTRLIGYAGMRDGDGLLMCNFRADRARQLLTALVDPSFDSFQPVRRVNFAARTGLVEYSKELSAYLETIFPPRSLDALFGEQVSAAGLRQLRLAETEKYPHVTYFFNGGQEAQFAGEDRVLVPSPKVATYDLQPEMSAPEVTDRMVEAVGSGQFDFILINYANPDMVGHTGDLQAAIRAVETVDRCLGRVVDAVVVAGGLMLVTADHGNCEIMRDEETGGPHTAHTLDPVPIVLVNGPEEVTGLKDGGRLADVAPTLLALMGLPQPAAMDGRSLLDRSP